MDTAIESAIKIYFLLIKLFAPSSTWLIKILIAGSVNTKIKPSKTTKSAISGIDVKLSAIYSAIGANPNRTDVTKRLKPTNERIKPNTIFKKYCLGNLNEKICITIKNAKSGSKEIKESKNDCPKNAVNEAFETLRPKMEVVEKALNTRYEIIVPSVAIPITPKLSSELFVCLMLQIPIASDIINGTVIIPVVVPLASKASIMFVSDETSIRSKIAI